MVKSQIVFIISLIIFPVMLCSLMNAAAIGNVIIVNIIIPLFRGISYLGKCSIFAFQTLYDSMYFICISGIQLITSIGYVFQYYIILPPIYGMSFIGYYTILALKWVLNILGDFPLIGETLYDLIFSKYSGWFILVLIVLMRIIRQKKGKGIIVPIEELNCPITYSKMESPVVAADGHTYEKDEIIKWIRIRGTSPLTRQALQIGDLHDNHLVKKIITNYS